MSDGIRIVTNRQWEALERQLSEVCKAKREMRGWVRQRDAYRLARISKTALIWARIHGRIEAVRVGDESPVWLYSAESCKAYHRDERRIPGSGRTPRKAGDAAAFAKLCESAEDPFSGNFIGHRPQVQATGGKNSAHLSGAEVHGKPTNA
jgi:hypothetical protein